MQHLHLRDEDQSAISSARYKADFATYLRTGDPGRLVAVGPVREGRAMGTSTPTSGGYLAPESFHQELWARLTGASAMRASASILDAIGSGVAIAYLDDSNRGRLATEGAAGTETDFTLALKRLPLFTFDSDIVRVSLQTLQDAGVEAIEQKLIDALALRVAANLNGYASTGSGAGEPQGLFRAVVTGVTGATGQTSVVTYDDLVDLVASVPDVYVYGRGGTRSAGRFMMNGNTLSSVRKLKDGDGQPVWRPDPNGQTAGTLLGFRIVVNGDAPSLGAGNRPIVFGLLGSYGIADGPVLIQRLSERYAELGQAAFRVVSRHGCGLIDPAGVRAYANAAS